MVTTKLSSRKKMRNTLFVSFLILIGLVRKARIYTAYTGRRTIYYGI